MSSDFPPAGRWRVDSERSTVGWSVKHLGVSTVRGVFEAFEGVLEDGRASGSVAAASVRTDEQQRDDFVRSEEFLGAEEFPLMRFAGVVGEDGSLEGDLTIRDTTMPLQLGMERGSAGQAEVELALRGTMRRRAYGLRFSQGMGAADRTVSDELELALDLVLLPAD